MKIEIGESLGYSYLRHVKQCWLVQANWKVSEHWGKRQSDESLESAFSDMRQRFDPDGVVFKGTKDGSQFLRQAEIDVVGVDQDGGVHAMEVAFHEAGLHYSGGTDNRVLKKLLRTRLILDAYHSEEVPRHIYFVSPKVHRGDQQSLEEIFSRLREVYPSVHWYLMINEKFSNELLGATLDKAETVADTSELFVRSAKLLKLAEGDRPNHASRLSRRMTARGETPDSLQRANRTRRTNGFQDIVRGLMRTLLEDHPALLGDEDRRNMMDADYCRESMDLRLSGVALLRRQEEGKMIGGHDRYYEKVYAGRYYVTNHWWKAHHSHNAASLLGFVERLIENRQDTVGIATLEEHRIALRDCL